MRSTLVRVNSSTLPASSAVERSDQTHLAGCPGGGALREPRREVDPHAAQLPDLVGLDNAFLFPHWGSTTDEDRAWMTKMAVENVIAALRGEKVPCEYEEEVKK